MMKQMNFKDPPLVLVVDDDITTRLLARAALEQANFAIAEAGDGLQALSAFKQLRPDIVLLDILMPEMDGFTACTELRHLPGGDAVPILVITGLDDLEAITRAYEVGATDFIHKPINWTILSHRVRYMVRAGRMFAELHESESRLLQSEAMLSRAEEIAHLGHWDLDLKTQKLTWSKETFRLFGKDPASFVPTFEAFWSTIHKEDRESSLLTRNAGLQAGQDFTIEYRITLPDGSWRFMQERVEFSRDKAINPCRIFGIVQDITSHKLAEASIEEGLRLLQQILDTIPSPIFYQGTEGRYQGVNQAFLQFYGKTMEQVLGKTVHEVFPQEIADKYFQMDQDLFQHPGTQVYEFHNYDAHGQRREMTLHKGTFFDKNGNLAGLAGIMIDITARKQDEEKIQRQSDQLRALALRLSAVQEIERQQLARDLHDEVCQNLASIAITLEILKIRARQEPLDRVLSRLSEATALVEQTGEVARDIMEGLRPTALDHYGLMGGLRQLRSRFSQGTGIALEILGEEPDPRLKPNVELALFRIAQEALNNADRHARASKVVLSITVDQDTVRLVIADNGIGFDQNVVTKPKEGRGWGLMTMNERALEVGGYCRIESQPGQGTRVVVEVSR